MQLVNGYLFHDSPTLRGAKLIPTADPDRFLIPPIMGAEDSPTTYPLDSLEVDGTRVTIDELQQEPSRITRDIANLAMQRMYMQDIFDAGGQLRGGAVLFERPNPIETDLFANREPKTVAPGTEFPVTTFSRGVPMVAKPRKIGNKFNVVREQRFVNDASVLRGDIVKQVNTITRRIEVMGLAELAAVTEAERRYTTLDPLKTWADFANTRMLDRVFTYGPVADIMTLQATIDEEERGHVLDSAVINPMDALLVTQAYPNQSLEQVFGSVRIRNVYVTHRKRAGSVFFFEKGAVGRWLNMWPLTEEAWEERRTQEWWYQWSIVPVFVVNDQFTFYELRGVNVL